MLNKKDYKITIKANELLYDIDAITHKSMVVLENANENVTPKSTFNVQTTSGELDRSLLTRMLDYRDSQLRVFMSSYLNEDDVVTEIDDTLKKEQDYIYNLSMYESWQSTLLKPLKEEIHRYLVYGTLYDYFSKTLPDMASHYEAEISEIESKMTNMLTTYKSNIYLRPLRPIF